jgi:hypothetical protein
VNNGPEIVVAATVVGGVESVFSEQPDIDTPIIRKKLKTMKIFMKRSMHNGYSSL